MHCILLSSEFLVEIWTVYFPAVLSIFGFWVLSLLEISTLDVFGVSEPRVALVYI